MKKYIIPLLIVLLCSIIVGGYYQLKKIGITNMSLNKDKPSIQKGDSVNITTQIVSEKKIMEIKYSTREPIPKGDSFTFHVTWDTLYISNIIFKDVYSPTKEEMKNGMYHACCSSRKNNYLPNTKGLYNRRITYFTS